MQPKQRMLRPPLGRVRITSARPTVSLLGKHQETSGRNEISRPIAAPSLPGETRAKRLDLRFRVSSLAFDSLSFLADWGPQCDPTPAFSSVVKPRAKPGRFTTSTDPKALLNTAVRISGTDLTNLETRRLRVKRKALKLDLRPREPSGLEIGRLAIRHWGSGTGLFSGLRDTRPATGLH